MESHGIQTMKSFKRTLLAAGAASLVLAVAACGGGGGGNDANGEEAAVLRRGISAKVDTLDPHRSSAKWENIVISDMIVGLMTITPDREVIPGVATSWETSEDGLTWTFKLRDSQWSDGEPVTADDFVYAFRRIQDPAIASQYSSLLYIVKNAAEVNAGELPPEELGVRAIDDHTFEITLEEPAPYLLGLLTHYTTYPVPKHIVEQYGEAWIQPENIEVNGPYKLAYWRTGDQLVAEKNPLYYEADELCFDRVAYFEIEDAAAVERRIESGELDINNGFDGGRTEELEAKFPGWVRTTPGLITTYWTFNSSQPPFDDVRVRKALALALDRDFIVDRVLTPGFVAAYSFVPPKMRQLMLKRVRKLSSLPARSSRSPATLSQPARFLRSARKSSISAAPSALKTSSTRFRRLSALRARTSPTAQPVPLRSTFAVLVPSVRWSCSTAAVCLTAR